MLQNTMKVADVCNLEIKKICNFAARYMSVNDMPFFILITFSTNLKGKNKLFRQKLIFSRLKEGNILYYKSLKSDSHFC